MLVENTEAMGSDTEGETGWGHVPSLGRSTIRGARLSLAGFVLSRGLDALSPTWSSPGL